MITARVGEHRLQYGLERCVRAAFGRYRRMRNRGGFHPDGRNINQRRAYNHPRRLNAMYSAADDSTIANNANG